MQRFMRSGYGVFCLLAELVIGPPQKKSLKRLWLTNRDITFALQSDLIKKKQQTWT